MTISCHVSWICFRWCHFQDKQWEVTIISHLLKNFIKWDLWQNLWLSSKPVILEFWLLMFWLVYWCLHVAVWGHVASRVPPKDFPRICIINICFSWQMRELSQKKSDTLRFSSYLYNEHMFQLTDERALAKKEGYHDTKNCHHDAMWKAATRHFASNEWDSKGILDFLFGVQCFQLLLIWDS